MPPPERFGDALAARLPELMQAAIDDARRADLPFGCVLAEFTTGALKGRAANSTASDPTGHAEVNALRLMAERQLDPRSIVLVSTAEPCPMCAAACYWAGVRGVVYGTSITDLIRFGWHQIDLPMPALLACARPPAAMILQGGFLTAQTDPLYRDGPRARPGGA
jgi:tRNA(Arg) A34 adenosine deaminase TadA